MRAGTGRLAAALAVAAVAVAAPAGTTPAGAAPNPVGGPLLSGTGIVVRPLPGAPRLPAGLTARGWVVADLDTGQVLAARDPHGRFLPASTQKVLTALTLIPRLSPTRLVSPTNADVGVDGSKVGLVPGTRYSVRTLFTSLLVVSANDAAQTLADAAGGIGPTLTWMNAEARYLHADDTHALTPSGLDAPGESTSAYDLALIARAAMQLPDFRHYVSVIVSYVNAPKNRRFQIYTHDRLLTSYPGALGIKNGYTVAAGGTFIGAARRHGHTLVVTLLHAQPSVWHEAASLLTWGFAAEGRVLPVGTLVAPGTPPASSGAVASRLRPQAATVATRHAGSALGLPLALAGVSTILLTGVVSRERRRSRRPRRMRLPP